MSQTSENNTARVVNDTLIEAHSRITDEPHLLPTSNVAPSVVPTQVFLSCSLPIDSRVSANLKREIWSDEYIDFGVLLSNPVTDKYHISLQNSAPSFRLRLFLNQFQNLKGF